MTIHSSIKARILEAQREASKGVNTLTEMSRGLDKQFKRKEDGGLYFVKRIWVPDYDNLRTLIMNEANATKYYVHPGTDKMYYNLQDIYWWPRMKNDIALYITVCEDYRIEKLARLYINEIVARHGVPISIYLIVTVIYIKILATTKESIRNATRFEYCLPSPDRWPDVSDKVLPKVAPWKGVVRFGIHDTFHVSNLKKCLADVNLHVPLEEIKIDDKLRFVEGPTEIMDREVKKLKRSWILIVKVCWNSDEDQNLLGKRR
nr:putative reverse transcriptase domain-containing protein [Tanacetum cinerariifolium]